MNKELAPQVLVGLILKLGFWVAATALAAFGGWWAVGFIALSYGQWFAFMAVAQAPVSIVLAGRDFGKEVDKRINAEVDKHK